MTIEKLISEWESELRKLDSEYDKHYWNDDYIDAARLSGRKTQLITCLVQLKILNEDISKGERSEAG